LRKGNPSKTAAKKKTNDHAKQLTVKRISNAPGDRSSSPVREIRPARKNRRSAKPELAAPAAATSARHGKKPPEPAGLVKKKIRNAAKATEAAANMIRRLRAEGLFFTSVTRLFGYSVIFI
jgi:hypothetical protein